MSENLQEIYLFVSDGGDGSASIRYTKDEDLAKFLVSDEYMEAGGDYSYCQNEGSYDTIIADISSVRYFTDAIEYLSATEKEAFLLFLSKK